MLIGYARVSTATQTTAPQEDELRRAGCGRTFSDMASGARSSRPGLDALLAQARRGDVVVVVRLDRLGRSLIHLVDVIRQLKTAGVGFRSLSEQIDTTTAGGKLIFHIFGSLAEFERELIRERVTAGLSAARARGRVGGRPRKDDSQRARVAASMLADPGNTVADVCRALGVSRATAYRLAQVGRQAPPPLAAMPASPTVKSPSRGQKRSQKPTRKRT